MATLFRFEFIQNKVRHGIGMQSLKHTCCSTLQAALKQAQLKKGVFKEFLLIPTAQIADIRLNKCMWTAVHRDQANVGTKCNNYPPQHNHLLTHITAEAIQDGNTDPTKLAVVSARNEGPGVLALLIKLNATVVIGLCPVEDLAQDTGVYAV